ncbi:MAG: transcriptional regulator [Jatrophihabitans sp.]|nr:MAG: transcriptional regulator [Jatrophihabitans sp.]
MNGFVVAVLDAATNPDLAGADAQRVRERLAAAGLLADIAPRAGARPSSRAVATARRAAGTGRRLADLVSNGRE